MMVLLKRGFYKVEIKTENNFKTFYLIVLNRVNVC